MADEMGPSAFMWPDDRAWSAAHDNTAPCGSVAAVGNRTIFPLTGGRIALVAQDESYQMRLSLSTSNDPQSNDDFQTLIEPEVLAEIDDGHTCIPVPDPPTGTAAGTNATLQIIYTADFDSDNNQTFYACTDITYVAAADFDITVPCFNATEDSGASFNHTQPTSTAEAAARNSGGGGGLSGGAIAGIVVGVVAGVGLLLVGAFMLYRTRSQRNSLMRQRDSVRQVKEDDIAGKDSTSQNSIQLNNLAPAEGRQA